MVLFLWRDKPTASWAIPDFHECVLIRWFNCKETHLSPHLALEREQLFLHGGDGTPKALVLVITSCVCTWGKEKESDLKVGNWDFSRRKALDLKRQLLCGVLGRLGVNWTQPCDFRGSQSIV